MVTFTVDLHPEPAPMPAADNHRPSSGSGRIGGLELRRIFVEDASQRIGWKRAGQADQAQE
jgi:hypothetical protein